MAAAPFTEAQIRRAIKAARAEDVCIGAIEVTKDGTIRILPAAPAAKHDEVDRFFNDKT